MTESRSDFLMEGIKIEENESFNSVMNPLQSTSSLLKDLLKASQNLNTFSCQSLGQDDGLTFFPTTTFESMTESHRKTNFELDMEDLRDFQV